MAGRVSIFTGVRIIDAKPRVYGLRQFLTADTGTDVFRRCFKINKGRLDLNVYFPDGTRFQGLRGFLGWDKAFAAIRQETSHGARRKVLYCWQDEADWGVLARAGASFELAKKRAGQVKWAIQTKPLRLAGQTDAQLARSRTKKLWPVLNGRVGPKGVVMSWPVLRHHSSSYIAYSLLFLDEKIKIYGFDDHAEVWSHISREGDAIVARFYANRRQLKQGQQMLKAVALSRLDNASGRWQPLFRPEVLASSRANPILLNRSEAAEVRFFLLADLADGEVLGPLIRRVYGSHRHGEVRFDIDSANGDLLCLSGYQGYRRVVGILRVEGDEKKAYFWENESAMATALPIKPEGHVVARRLDGQWQIVLRNSLALQAKLLETEYYKRYLFATVGPRVFDLPWRVVSSRAPGSWKRWLSRTINKIDRRVPVPRGVIIGEEGFSSTQEFGRRLKLVEFWGTEAQSLRGELPFAAKFITLRPNGSPWQMFWHEPEQMPRRLVQLHRQGKLSGDDLSAIVQSPYLLERYRPLCLAV